MLREQIDTLTGTLNSVQWRQLDQTTQHSLANLPRSIESTIFSDLFDDGRKNMYQAYRDLDKLNHMDIREWITERNPVLLAFPSRTYLGRFVEFFNVTKCATKNFPCTIKPCRILHSSVIYLLHKLESIDTNASITRSRYFVDNCETVNIRTSPKNHEQ